MIEHALDRHVTAFVVLELCENHEEKRAQERTQYLQKVGIFGIIELGGP